MGGRRPKPIELKILEGNPGKRALPRPNAPQPELGGGDKPPSHLSKDARTEWDRISRELDRLGLLRKVDRTAFAGYCEAFATWLKAKRVIQRKGLTYEHKGLIRKRPEVSIASDAMRIMRQFIGEFGLSPSSRGRVAAIVSDAAQMPIPGIGDAPPATDPSKPKLPVLGDFTDDDYLDGPRH